MPLLDILRLRLQYSHLISLGLFTAWGDSKPVTLPYSRGSRSIEQSQRVLELPELLWRQLSFLSTLGIKRHGSCLSNPLG